jgi:hypothetical protein
MLEEIKDIIAKSLPAQVGKTLQEELARIPQLEKALQDKDRKGIQDAQVIEDLQKRLTVYTSMEAKYQDLEVREKAITTREDKLELLLAKHTAAEAEKRATELHGIVQTVFKSPVYRKSIFNSTHYDGNGRTYPVPMGEDTTID